MCIRDRRGYRPFFFAHTETEHSIPDKRINVGGILCTLGRIIVHQFLEHLFPAGELYIYKTVCVIPVSYTHLRSQSV